MIMAMDTGKPRAKPEAGATDSRPFLRPRPVQVAAALAAAVIGSAVVIGSGIASTGESAASIGAMGFTDARVLGKRAEALFNRASTDPADRATARELAQRALARDALIPRAVRTLALIDTLEGRATNARKLIDYSHWLTRRDLGTNLYLIEQAVGRGDTAGALTHFDTALRTDRAAYPILFPVLADAIQDPQLLRPIGRMLSANPIWLRAYVDYSVGAKPSLAPLSRILRTMPNSPALDRSAHSLVTARLAEEGRYALAGAYVQAIRPAPQLVRGPSFGAEDAVMPFGWEFREEAGLSADSERAPDGSSQGMSLSADQDRSGWVASQMTALPAGTYRLQTAGHISGRGGTASWIVMCLPTETTLGRLPLPTGEGDSTVTATFSIPKQGCEGQLLRLDLSAMDEAVSGTVGTVTIQAAAGPDKH